MHIARLVQQIFVFRHQDHNVQILVITHECSKKSKWQDIQLGSVTKISKRNNF